LTCIGYVSDEPGMTASDAQLLPLSEVREMLTSVMENKAGWAVDLHRECSCDGEHRTPDGKNLPACLLPLRPEGHLFLECRNTPQCEETREAAHGCQAREHWTLKPPGMGLRSSDLLTAIKDLPDPAPADRVASAVLAVLKARGHAPELLPFLAMEAEARWPEDGQSAPEPENTSYRPRCAHCGGAIPATRGKASRYCSNAHRVAAHKARKRAESGNGASHGAGSVST
jgi:hypothetical protein